MRIYTDSREYARRLFARASAWRAVEPGDRMGDPGLRRLGDGIFEKGPIWEGETPGFGYRNAFLIKSAPASQYDLVLDLIRSGVRLPDGLLCLAGEGRGFHGLRGRPWTAEPGNLHLTAYFRPGKKIPRFYAAWPALAAVSCVEAIDDLPGLGGRAGIKWVNDILIGEAKTAGFLAASQIQDEIVLGALLGIGLNVEKAPAAVFDSAVPRATCLREHCTCSRSCSESAVLSRLLERIQRNVIGLENGGGDALVEAYRKRSIAPGRRVRILSDAPGEPSREIAAGRVASIGYDLELYLCGRMEPVRQGRLILEPEE